MADVLVVEDDPDIRALLEIRLRRAGHRVTGVGSGSEALAVLATDGVPDVAVLDVLMPGMTGLELLARMRAEQSWAGVPAVFLSGRVQAADVEAGRALGAAYLTKPVAPAALVRAVDDALTGAGAA